VARVGGEGEGSTFRCPGSPRVPSSVGHLQQRCLVDKHGRVQRWWVVETRTMAFRCGGTQDYVGPGLLNCVPHERALPIYRVSPQNRPLLVREASDTTQTVAPPLQRA